jgi:hypothetical protein
MDLNRVDDSIIPSINPLTYRLADGSEWTFMPKEDQDTRSWGEASTYINNVKKIG